MPRDPRASVVSRSAVRGPAICVGSRAFRLACAVVLIDRPRRTASCRSRRVGAVHHRRGGVPCPHARRAAAALARVVRGEWPERRRAVGPHQSLARIGVRARRHAGPSARGSHGSRYPAAAGGRRRGARPRTGPRLAQRLHPARAPRDRDGDVRHRARHGIHASCAGSGDRAECVDAHRAGRRRRPWISVAAPLVLAVRGAARGGAGRARVGDASVATSQRSCVPPRHRSSTRSLANRCAERSTPSSDFLNDRRMRRCES